MGNPHCVHYTACHSSTFATLGFWSESQDGFSKVLAGQTWPDRPVLLLHPRRHPAPPQHCHLCCDCRFPGCCKKKNTRGKRVQQERRWRRRRWEILIGFAFFQVVEWPLTQWTSSPSTPSSSFSLASLGSLTQFRSSLLICVVDAIFSYFSTSIWLSDLVWFHIAGCNKSVPCWSSAGGERTPPCHLQAGRGHQHPQRFLHLCHLCLQEERMEEDSALVEKPRPPRV